MTAAARIALGTALLAALSAGPVAPRTRRVLARTEPLTAGSTAREQALCPPGTLPDGEECVPFVGVRAGEGRELSSTQNEHVDRRGRRVVYEQIARQPDRPAAYERYRYPIPTDPADKLVVSGYDLDRPDTDQRRGAHLSAVGHGGIDLVARRGTEVRLLPLEHQEGDAEVLYAGTLFGTTVVTRQTIREAGRLWDHVVLHGHLDAIERGIEKGRTVREGELLGQVGDTGSEGLVHLHYEVRRAREGVRVFDLTPGQLIENARTIVVDPRNVLPLRDP